MEKLFEKNSYLKEFKSQITKVDKEKKIIELEETAFYGKSGGQPGDTGIIVTKNNEIKVLETLKENNRLIHYLETVEKIEEKMEIRGKINWKKRYKFMRMHTALHVLCAVIPMEVTGGQIGENKSRLDFNVKDKKLVKEEIQEKINRILEQNYEITYQWITKKELEEKPKLIRTMSVKPPTNSEKIRLVKIGDIDLQPCGGTHIKNTSELGSIIIGKIENKGKLNKRINLSLND